MANDVIVYRTGPCRWGVLLVAGGERGVCAVSLGASEAALVTALRDDFSEVTCADGLSSPAAARVNEWYNAVSDWLEREDWLERGGETPDLPLDVRGTPFRQRVWQALREIPAGTTVTYSDIATRIGAPRAVRAAASACGANRLAVLIPCHRVIARDGGLAGYRWGLELKAALLAFERSHLS